jgi:hypothetical protein
MASRSRKGQKEVGCTDLQAKFKTVKGTLVLV